uniref:Uncharacterized protein n=1 Tax=Porodaedalea pini TaxID=108901 RepID=A0A5B9RAT0_9AGAM|nr:hypothetical protein PPIT_000120 [Porodaedalea pini]QEG57016.1 hypothetical protein PPIT_000120 [Porodaedalea pini]
MKLCKSLIGLKFVKVNDKNTVVEFIFESPTHSYPSYFTHYLIWIYTFMYVYNTELAPFFAKGFIEGTLLGKEVKVTISFSEFWSTVQPGDGGKVHTCKFIYTPKHKSSLTSVKYFVNRIRKSISKQTNGLAMGYDDRYFILELKIVIPKVPSSTEKIQ